LKRYDDYDAFAWVYNRSLGPDSTNRFYAVIERLLLKRLSPGAHVLDLCCGTGQLAQALSERGFDVAGIDGSGEMLRYARANAPRAAFELNDARHFDRLPTYQGVIAAFDSLNHVMHFDELCQVFRNVYGCLLDGGYFLMDLNLDAGYRARWLGCSVLTEEDYVCIIRPTYDESSGIGQAAITLFRSVQETWDRTDLELTQRCYSVEELETGLVQAGFQNIQTFDALNDLSLTGGIGRAYFLAEKAD